MDLKEAFDKFENEYLKFERVQHKLSNRPDLHAFILLDRLAPSKCDIVSAAEHDEIYLDVDPTELAKAVTEDEIRDLVRCGVRFDASLDSLALFV